MARKTRVPQASIDAYWRNAEIQDRFWRELFVSFIKPLNPLYEDPLSAGAHVLSAFLINPHDAAREFECNPEAFGELRACAPTELAGAIYRDLLTGKHGVTLELCRSRFQDQRIAGAEIAQFADEQPSACRRLQKERCCGRGPAGYEAIFYSSVCHQVGRQRSCVMISVEDSSDSETREAAALLLINVRYKSSGLHQSKAN